MAAVYSAGDFRNGTTFEMEGNVFRVVEFQHVKPGKGSAFVRTKLKNVITGAVLEKTFNPSDKYPGAEIEKKEMQYLYNDGDLYYFPTFVCMKISFFSYPVSFFFSTIFFFATFTWFSLIFTSLITCRHIFFFCYYLNKLYLEADALCFF